jgi:hypothetical protein
MNTGQYRKHSKMIKHPGIGKEIREGGFQKGFDAIPKEFRPDARKTICELCYWGKDNFIHKLYGRRPFRLYESEQITKYFASLGIDAWTGLPINN